jgi:hypothetical protein
MFDIQCILVVFFFQLVWSSGNSCVLNMESVQVMFFVQKNKIALQTSHDLIFLNPYVHSLGNILSDQWTCQTNLLSMRQNFDQA